MKLRLWSWLKLVRLHPTQRLYLQSTVSRYPNDFEQPGSVQQNVYQINGGRHGVQAVHSVSDEVQAEQEEHGRGDLVHDKRDDDHAKLDARQTRGRPRELLPARAVALPRVDWRDPAVDLPDAPADRVDQQRVEQ